MTTLDEIEKRLTDAERRWPDSIERVIFPFFYDDIRALLAVARAAETAVRMFDLLRDPFDQTAEGNATFVGERLDHAERELRTALANLTKENQGT